MTNYQILEIAIDIGYFLTVASVAVLFAILREKSIKKSLNVSQPSEGTQFNRILNDAAKAAPAAEDIQREPSPAERPAVERRPVFRPAASAAQTGGLSRAEQEFIKSIAVE